MFRDLRADYDRHLVDAVFDEILEPYFPTDELAPRGWFHEGLLAPDGRLEALVTTGRDGAVRAVAVAERYVEGTVFLISYLAASPGLQGRGPGMRIAFEAQQRWSAVPGVRLLLAEVEDPRHHPAADAAHRLELFRRFGMTVLAAPYFQPRHSYAARRVPHMLLLVDAASPDLRRSADSVDGGLIRAFLREYFTITEGAWVLDTDPHVLWLFSQYQDAEIPLLPLESVNEVPDAEPPPRGSRPRIRTG